MAKIVDNKKLIEKAEGTKAAVKTAVKTAVKNVKVDRRKVAGTVKNADKRKGANTKINSHKLELLITVVNRQKTEYYVDLLQSFDVNMQFVLRAHGTASKQTLHLLGLEETPKSVILSVIREDKLQDALTMLSYKFQTIKGGAGVAYTVPLTSVIGVAIFGFLSNNAKTVKEDKNNDKV